MTENDEQQQLRAVAVDVEQLGRVMAAFEGYRAMVAVLLPNHEEHDTGLNYLRGLARIGIDSPPNPEDDAGGMGADLHRHVMATLEYVGAEPMTTEEVERLEREAVRAIVYAASHAVPEDQSRTH